MASTAGLCNQAKVDFLNGVHQPGDIYKLALFTDNSNMTPTNTTVYTANGTGVYAGRMQGEHANTGTYTSGGAPISTGNYVATLVGDVAYIDFPVGDGPIWTGTNFTSVTTALLYNSSKPGNKAIAIFKFNVVNTVSGTLLAKLPDPGTGAIIRFA